MSADEQRKLGDYTAPSDSDVPLVGQTDDEHSAHVSAPGWMDTSDEGDAPDHRRCLNCDRHVTAQFARVSGDNENQVHRCPNCANGSELAHGAAGLEDFEHRVEGGLYQ